MRPLPSNLFDTTTPVCVVSPPSRVPPAHLTTGVQCRDRRSARCGGLSSSKCTSATEAQSNETPSSTRALMTARFPWKVSVIAATNTPHSPQIRKSAVRCAHHTMAPTKRTAVVPQAPVHGINVGAIGDSESATMTSALIFLHLAFLPTSGSRLGTAYIAEEPFD